jgi:ABC-type methionine transport system ATPase subunit
MPPKSKAPDKKLNATEVRQQRRLWLMYPPKLIKEPLIWQLSQKFPVVTNIRQASVTDEIGIVSLELDGRRPDIKAAIKWLEKIGVSVEPVEINIIES